MGKKQFEVNGLLVETNAPQTLQTNRPPVLLVHGACHGAWCWDFWMDALPELGWECFALSLRNHPGSRKVDEQTFLTATTIDDYASDVAEVAAHIGRPSVVIGHSMGGMVTQRFVELDGSQAGMVLLTSSPPGQLPAIRREPLPVDVPYLPSPEESARRFFHTASPDVVEWAVSQLVPESTSVMNRYSLEQGNQINPEAITCPALVVSAGMDGTPVPKDDRIAKFYGADYIFEAGMGHDVMLEADWRELLVKITAWSESHCVHS